MNIAQPCTPPMRPVHRTTCTSTNTTRTSLIPMSDELLTMARAAQLCDVNKSTIVRRRQRGDFPHAQKKDDGTWVIPVADLIAAGLTDKVGQPTNPPENHTASARDAHTPTGTDAMHQLEEENTRLKAQLGMQNTLHQRDVQHHQDMLAHKDATITALQTAIRALEAPRPHNDLTTTSPPRRSHTHPPHTPRRRTNLHTALSCVSADSSLRGDLIPTSREHFRHFDICYGANIEVQLIF